MTMGHRTSFPHIGFEQPTVFTQTSMLEGSAGGNSMRAIDPSSRQLLGGDSAGAGEEEGPERQDRERRVPSPASQLNLLQKKRRYKAKRMTFNLQKTMTGSKLKYDPSKPNLT